MLPSFQAAAVSLFMYGLLILSPGMSMAADTVRAPAALPGCTVEMNNPEFWINRITEPDRVIMSTTQIRAFNAKNAVRTVAPAHPYAQNIAQIEKDGPIFTMGGPSGRGKNH